MFKGYYIKLLDKSLKNYPEEPIIKGRTQLRKFQIPIRIESQFHETMNYTVLTKVNNTGSFTVQKRSHDL